MSDRVKEQFFWILMLAGMVLCLAGLLYGIISAGAAATILALLALLTIIKWARESLVTVKLLSLIATLTAIAALSRVPFAALPGVQPTTFLIIVSGFVFGPQAGFMTGAMAALVSNFFLGQGPWTPWQMLGWGLTGMSAAYLGRLKPNLAPWALAVFAGLWGYLFGWIQNIGFATVFIYPLTLKAYLASCVLSFAFDSIHALTNFLLCLFLSLSVIKILQNFRQRLDYRYVQADSEHHLAAMDCPQENDDKSGS